ncbi:hypothetical protein M9H77_25304 [Catharanthus roseus]|uniref:Uncharacterized protein n=1 Tax=Catharanthus roseus TaxID=4058 RepID=A0ACC0A7E6_CATRO|nr:hypothetical protein M9H77_25304 [Catharanthus roseus]
MFHLAIYYDFSRNKTLVVQLEIWNPKCVISLYCYRKLVQEVRRLIKGVLHSVLPDDPCSHCQPPKRQQSKRDDGRRILPKGISLTGNTVPRSGRGSGRGHSSGRSNFSSLVSPDSPPVPFPLNNVFPGFMYQFIQNWKNVVGDGNRGFRVVSNFLFGDENHWVEIRRRMSYDLRHHIHVYEQLFGSVERVTELIMKINSEEGLAPPEYWMDTPDHVYVIANTFNLCVVFLAWLELTTVLPLVSNMDGPAGTVFIGLIEELQHFIQMDAICPHYRCNAIIIEICELVDGRPHIVIG